MIFRVLEKERERDYYILKANCKGEETSIYINIVSLSIFIIEEIIMNLYF